MDRPLDHCAVAERVAILHEQVDDGSCIVHLDDEALFIGAIDSDSRLTELDPFGRAGSMLLAYGKRKPEKGMVTTILAHTLQSFSMVLAWLKSCSRSISLGVISQECY